MGEPSGPTKDTDQPSEAAGASASPGPEAKPKNVAALSRELADFLIEFSIVLHKRSMYPAGHPHLRDSSERFASRLNALLGTRESVTLGVARHRLVIETVTTDPRNALLRDLAHRLHRHRIAAVHLTRGATAVEIEDVLAALSTDPQRGDGPVGKRLDRVGPWDHIRLRPIGYDKFMLQDPDAAMDFNRDEPADGRDAWVELARLALSSEYDTTSTVHADPLVVAQAIGRKSGEVAYDRVVLGYLSRVAEELSGRKGAGDDQLSERLSGLIEALDPDTLRRLLETGANQAERRQFVLNASQILAADAVMEVLEAAAKASHQTISHNLLNLLHKLAQHAEGGPPRTRTEAEGALRNNVARLIGDWELEDPNPESYTAILEGMVRRAPDSSEEAQSGCEPEIIIKMALELDCVGPSVYAAAEALLNRRQLALLVAQLKAAPHTESAEALWRHIASPQRLEAELALASPDQTVIEILVGRLGVGAANSLLDHLGRTDDRSTRAAIMKQLLALGPRIGEVAVARLIDAPWYLQRNILVLIGRLGRWPEGFSPLSYAAHADPRIRREGIKLLLESRTHVAEGVSLGLRDEDDAIVGLALRAALESCPPDAIPLVERIAMDTRRPTEVRLATLRILARTRTPEALKVLLAHAQHRRFWFGRRLASKSPELLTVLAGLASYWKHDPTAAEVLASALQHSDPEIRAAARSAAA